MQTMTNIVKSVVDKRHYRFRKLPNELWCMLVSDEEADKAAVSLSVNVGYVYDKPELMGLAHFLEHMLKLGTGKFPVENEYDKFVSAHAGRKNAATGDLYTFYYFDCAPHALRHGMDIFSHFFIDPLFPENAAEREMNAVDSEYKKNLQMDARRLLQIQRTYVSHPDSPMSKFSTGCFETLNKPGVRDALIEFHDKYYSSNIMKLCVVGKEPLDTLEQWVEELFSPIENKNVVLPDLSQPWPFPREQMGRIFKIVPVRDLRELRINWALPYSQKEYKKKINAYLTHVFGHEGPRSLLSYLIKRGLGTALTCGSNHYLDCVDTVFVSISLTEEGEANFWEVAEIVYGFVNQIERSP